MLEVLPLEVRDQELRLDFVTSATRSRKPVVMADLNLALEPLKFMEFSLEATTLPDEFRMNRS